MSRGRSPGSFYSSTSRSSSSFSSSPDTPRLTHSSRDSETLKSILEKITSLQSAQQVVLERLDDNEARFQEIQDRLVNPDRPHAQPLTKEPAKPGRRSRRTPASLQVSSLDFNDLTHFFMPCKTAIYTYSHTHLCDWFMVLKFKLVP